MSPGLKRLSRYIDRPIDNLRCQFAPLPLRLQLRCRARALVPARTPPASPDSRLCASTIVASSQDPPRPIRLPAGGTDDRLLLAIDHDRLLEVAAVPLGRLVRARRGHGAEVAGIRVAPGRGRAGRMVFQRGVGGLLSIEPVGAVERFTRLAADPGADQRARRGRGELARAVADLGPE